MNKQEASLCLEPYADRIIVKKDPAVEKTQGGIYIPDTAKERPVKGTIVAVGPGRADYTMQSKVGDRVLYGKYGGTELPADDELQMLGDDYLIMRESDIYAKILKNEQ